MLAPETLQVPPMPSQPETLSPETSDLVASVRGTICGRPSSAPNGQIYKVRAPRVGPSTKEERATSEKIGRPKAPKPQSVERRIIEAFLLKRKTPSPLGGGAAPYGAPSCEFCSPTLCVLLPLNCQPQTHRKALGAVGENSQDEGLDKPSQDPKNPMQNP